MTRHAERTRPFPPKSYGSRPHATQFVPLLDWTRTRRVRSYSYFDPLLLFSPPPQPRQQR
jgi:hypothetical protein